MRKPLFFVIIIALAYALPLFAYAAPLTFVSDLISYPAPGVGIGSHTVQFTATQAIPPSGSIVLTPQDGAFDIPSDFDYTKMQFNVWNGSAYAPRSLAAAPDASDDGVTVVSGTSGSIAITLSSTSGISAGEKVQIKLGPDFSSATSSDGIVNPTQDGSYTINVATKDALGAPLDVGTTLIAVTDPIGLDIYAENTAPTLSNGLPSGQIAAGNSVIELSLESDGPATCRYSTTPGVDYDAMTNTFNTADSLLFYTVLSGFQDDTSYNYYVRCISQQGAVDTSDYVISFNLAPTPSSNTSVTQAGGTVGQGSYPNGSETLYLANATLTGFTAPNSSVVALKDGVQAATGNADQSGKFSLNIFQLERGTYTFGVYSNDTAGLKSASFDTTLSFNQATNNTISGILLPPTLTLNSTKVNVGDPVRVLGSTAPLATTSVTLTPASGAALSYTATSTGSGSWEVDVPSGTLSQGTYTVSATAGLAGLQSDPSTPAFLGVGENPSPNLANRSDINGDGKVNLIDFSIMLSFWGTSNAKADINGDGTVNLADFSILLFNWTG